MNVKKQIPCLDGWFTMPPQEIHLIGNRCEDCGHLFFPKAKVCRNPFCKKTKPLKETLLNKKGKLFAYTINHYSPPPPYHAPDPFVPFAVASIALPEGIKVGGQVPKDVDLNKIKVGMEMETVLEVLYEDEEGNEVMSWMFRPVK